MEQGEHPGVATYRLVVAIQRRTDQRLGQYLSQVFQLTLPQYRFLELLFLNGPLLLGQISELLRCSPGNITGIRGRIERDGWIEQTQDVTDLRMVRVRLLLDREFAIVHRAVNELIAELIPADPASLNALQQVAQSFHQPAAERERGDPHAACE